MDLALNNLQRLICHKTQPTNQIKIAVVWKVSIRRPISCTSRLLSNPLGERSKLTTYYCYYGHLHVLQIYQTFCNM